MLSTSTIIDNISITHHNSIVSLQIFTKKLKYIEDYRLIDGRLAICAVAVGAAMFALIWDYLYPFPLSKYETRWISVVFVFARL